MQERIALVGQRSKVLEPVAGDLVHRGFDVRWATSASGALNDFGTFVPEVLVLGRGVSVPQRATLLAAFTARAPDLVVIDGLGPDTGLIVAQIQQAIGTHVILVSASLDEDSVHFTLTKPARVEVREYRFDPLMRARVETAADMEFAAGAHTVALPRRRRRRHVVVRGGAEVLVLSSATQRADG